jgi:ribulose-phosphate 3-epimerase
MADIVPTITADNPHIYRTQLEKLETFANRLHVDISDGEFAPSKLVSINQIYWTEGQIIDLHMMVHDPGQFINDYLALSPDLVVAQAEARDGQLDKLALFEKLRRVGIKTGLGLLAATAVSDHEKLIRAVSHVLIFAGNLGYQGGQADLSCLAKIDQVRALNPEAEIAWDGGVNVENATKLIEAGVDVLNVGGYISRSEAPQDAYAILEKIARAGG